MNALETDKKDFDRILTTSSILIFLLIAVGFIVFMVACFFKQ